MRAVEVAIVGAGVTGLSSALHLRERGIGPVLVLDRSGVNAGASGVQPGGVRRQWSTREHCLLALESYDYYQDFGARVEARTGPRLEPCGYLFLAHSSAKLDELATGVELQNSLGIPSQIVPPERLVELVPGLDPSSLTGAAWCGTDGYFDLPQGVVEAFAEAAVRAGAELLLDTPRSSSSCRDDEGWRVRLRSGACWPATSCSPRATTPPRSRPRSGSSFRSSPSSASSS